jgi:hypothetical protein
MSFHPSRLVTIEVVTILIVAPMVFWLALYAAARLWSFALRPLFQWLRILRWTAWILGMALVLAYVIGDVVPLAYGIALFTFSVGLSIPERWAKRRFARDLIEPANSDGR